MAKRRLLKALGGRRNLLIAYLALLVFSHVFIWQQRPHPYDASTSLTGVDRVAARVPHMTDDGPLRAALASLSVVRWPAPPPEAPGAALDPIILFHGSPSTGAPDFRRLAPLLVEPGRDVYVFEGPGFGRSDPSRAGYSNIATARTFLAAMDELAIERAHVVGWSFGGAAALQMSRLAPERLASMTLLAALGTQEAEGSGDHYFEHGKYMIGWALLVALPEFVPHFGLLGRREARIAFIRNFWDSDLRPVREQMADVTTPTLILHGRRDFLTPAWGAELHYTLIPTSRLVMLDASHFIPFSAPQAAADHILPFIHRHDDPAAPPLRGAADYAPVNGELATKGRLGRFEFMHGTHWALLILIIMLGTFISEDATVIGVGILIAAGNIDAGVGFLGCFLGIAAGDALLWSIGRFMGRRALHWPFVRDWLPEKALERWGRAFDRHAIKAVFLARAIPGTRMPTYLAAGMLTGRANRFILWALLAAVLWTPILLILAAFIGPHLLQIFHYVFDGPIALVAALVVLFVGFRIVTLACTRAGRVRLGVSFRKIFRPEYWPPWFFYIPLAPWVLWLAIRNRGPMSFTCLNPSVPHGGGVVGESKHQMMKALAEGGAGEWLVATELIDAGPPPDERAARADRITTTIPAFGDYPVVLKPDASQRGHAFKVIRSKRDAILYFTDMTRPALLQQYHRGPHEIGVLWSRRPGAAPDEPGFIFSITRKVFPVIEGDGERTLEELIWAHPRFRMQAPIFLRRFVDQTDRILFKGEKLRLAVAGNHCQGTMFLDGADLITPELTKRIDDIARRFTGPGFDFGRFDIRYKSDESLKRGEDFAVIELNGAMSESTNLYDPTKSVFWTYSVLFRQWTLMYRIGAQRRRQGVRPMKLRELAEAVRDHYRGRPGSEIAD